MANKKMDYREDVGKTNPINFLASLEILKTLTALKRMTATGVHGVVSENI